MIEIKLLFWSQILSDAENNLHLSNWICDEI